MSNRKDLIIPPDSEIADGHVRFTGDVVFGDHSTCDLHLDTEGRLFAGQGVVFRGGIDAQGDVNIDRSTVVHGDLVSRGSVYLGERVRVHGRVFAGQDLDVAAEVDIEGGFDVRGWINVRSPIPIVIHFIILLMELLRQGRSEEVERILMELEEMEEIRVNEGYAFVPSGSSVGEVVDSTGGCRVGDRSHVPGIRASDWVRVGCGVEVLGAIRSGSDASLAEGVLVHGDVTAEGRLVMGPGVHVDGSIRARTATLARDAVVRGEIIAPKGIRFTDQPRVEIEERLGKFEVGMEAVSEMLQ